MYSIIQHAERHRCKAIQERQMKRKPVAGKSKAKGKAAAGSRIYTRPELYERERPAATWAVRLGIVLTMLVMALVFRQPLHAAISSVFGA
jgi:hypothetical protein